MISYQGTSGILNAGEKDSLSFDVVLKDMSIHQDGIEGALIGDYEVFFTTGGSEIAILRRQFYYIFHFFQFLNVPLIELIVW